MRTVAEPVQPRRAATVLLLRPGTDDPFEVFMVRRHLDSKFMGGMYVFPGGKVDERDCVSDVGQVCHGLTAAGAAEILGGGLSPEDALGHFVAAIRETLEEAGVLLAVDAAGAVATLAPGELAQHRHALQNGDSAMADVITCLGLRLDTGRLRYFSHWITPPLEPRRFSARFFLCPVSAEQEAVHDAFETTDGVWLWEFNTGTRVCMHRSVKI